MNTNTMYCGQDVQVMVGECHVRICSRAHPSDGWVPVEDIPYLIHILQQIEDEQQLAVAARATAPVASVEGAQP